MSKRHIFNLLKDLRRIGLTYALSLIYIHFYIQLIAYKNEYQAMNKRILILQGNPCQDSYCFALAETYKKSAIDSGAEVKIYSSTSILQNINTNSDLNLKMI
jgi:hypothetical protein